MDEEYGRILQAAQTLRAEYDISGEELGLIQTVGEQLKVGADELMTFLSKMPEDAGGVELEQRIQAQGKVVTTCMMAALTIGGLQQQFQTISAAAGGIISRLLNWFLNSLLGLLRKYWQHIAVDSWSVGVSGGFPLGINATITVTFK